MTSQGTVREWDEDQGFGVIDSADTPGGCWVHFSSVVMDGYRALVPSDSVTFVFESGEQDGYAYRALQVWPPGVATGTPLPPRMENSSAYQSTLTIRWADGTIANGIPNEGRPRPKP